MSLNRASSGAGENQKRTRTPKDLIGDVATYVSSGGGLALLISVAVGASRSPVIWGCGVALVVLFVCVLFWRYDVVGARPRWRRMAFFAVMGVSAIVVPLAGLLQLLFPPHTFPQTAAVKDCRAVGPLSGQRVGSLPPGINGLLSMDVYKCYVESPVPGDAPVYLGPGETDETGEMPKNTYQWFVCWLPGSGAPAWYYTQGDFPGQPGTAQMNAWGVLASSLKPDPAVPGCPPSIRDTVSGAERS